MTASPPPALRDLLTQSLAPQRPFAYPRSAWLRWTGDLPHVAETIASLPDAVDRGVVARAIESLLQRDEVVPAFVAAMIWGYGSSNYGPSRTARILAGATTSGVTATGALAESARIVRSDGGPVEAYRYLNNDGHLEGLGPAFFTKWLYFATARGPERSARAAPVLDALVIRWLRREAGVALRYGKTADYQIYVDLLRE